MALAAPAARQSSRIEHEPWCLDRGQSTRGCAPIVALAAMRACALERERERALCTRSRTPTVAAAANPFVAVAGCSAGANRAVARTAALGTE
eukprot:SAG31_NODE_8271_length_1483_cov_3.692794_1_plen_91_part_10